MSTIPQKNYYDQYWTTGKQTFSGSNQGYAPNFRRWMAQELKRMSRQAPVLEVGCGDASFTKDLAMLSESVTAIDISEAQIKENQARYPRIKFLQHDVSEVFPFVDGSFEAVWCSEVLEHLFDPLYALREMHRITRRGGKLLVTVPFHGMFKNLLITLFKWDEHFVPSNPHIRFYTKQTISDLAAKAGFVDIKVETCGMCAPVRDLFVPTNILLSAHKK